MKKILSFLFIISGPGLFSQQISLIKETIVMHLNEEYIDVNGVYYFSKTYGDKRSFTVFHPLPFEPDSTASIDVNNMDEGSAVFFTIKNKGLSFKCNFSAGDTAMINITYRYVHNMADVKHILFSDREWKNPLQEADYLLYASNKLVIKSLSYKPDSVYDQPDSKLYHMHREGFMPDKDYVVKFEKKPPPKK